MRKVSVSTFSSRLSGVIVGLLATAGAIGHTAQPADTAQVWQAPQDSVLSLAGDDIPDLVVGSGPGRGDVRVFSGATLGLLAAGAPFGGGFSGGVRVAAGDITGDGVADVVIATASAGGRVRAFDGATLALLADFEPYGPGFGGGVSVAVGDIDADGRGDLVVAPASGAAPMRAYSGADGSVIGSGTPFGGYAGGVHVAVGDITGDGLADIVAAQARGGLVSLFSGAGFAPLGSGAPYGPAFSGGVSVAVGDVNGDGRGDVITAPLSGIEPVRAYDVPTLTVLSSGLPFGPTFAGGVRVAASDIDGDGRAEVVTATATGSSRVRVFSGATQAVLADFLAFDPAFVGGADVSVPTWRGLRFTSPATTTVTVGTAASFTVRAEGTPAVTSITRTGPLPGGITFTDNGDGTGMLAGTPAIGTGGTYTLTFTARNGTTRTATQSFALRVEEAPAITSAASTTFRVGQAGAFEVVTRGFPTPDLSVSGALPTGVTFTDLDTGRATLSGTPASGTSGVYPLTITATNGVGSAAAQSFTLHVESAPAFTSPDSVSFVVGTAQTFGVTTTGEPAVTSITRSGTLPPGLTYTDNGNGTATVAGTAVAGSGGSYPQTLTASNGVGTPAVQVLTITVRQAPQITSAAAATFVAGVAGTFTVTATGSPAPSLTVTGALPAGVTFVDSGTGSGTLAGTAAAGGTFPLTVTASNGVGAPAVQSFTLTVQQAPAITSAATTSFNVNTPGSFLITTTGVPVPGITVSGTLPGGVIAVDNGNGTGSIAGTPIAGSAGSYPLVITAANSVGSAVQNFTLIVQAPPAITSPSSTTFTVGTASSFTVTATGSPTPILSQTGALPTGVTFTPATGVLGGTPTQTGTFSSIQFTATNGVPPDATQNFTLTVSCPAITISSTTLPDGGFNAPYGPITFTASGATGSALTWSATGLPAGLGIGTTSGSVSGTPTTTVLNAAITVSVADEFGCGASRVVGLTVRPSATDNTFTGGVGNTQFVVGPTGPSTPHVRVTGSVLTNDAGPGTLSAAVSVQPPNGTVTMSTDGTFVYTPTTGFAGPTDTFVYTLTDGNGVTNTANVQIGLSGVVWYVNSAGTAGTGRSDSPFSSLASAAGPSLDGQTIYVHAGSGNTPGNLALRPGQTLFGQGATFILNGLLIPGGTRPALSGTVTLATGSAIAGVAFNTTGTTAINDPAAPITGVLISNGVTVTTTAAAAVALSDASGTFTFERISVDGGTNALSLTNVSGPFTVAGTGTPGTGGLIQNIVGDAVRLSNTSGVVSLAYMTFQDIGSMAGAAGTVSGHDAIHGELVQAGLVLTGVQMRRLSDHAILGSQIGSPSTPTVWNNLAIVDSVIEDSNRFHVAGLGDGGDEAMVRLLGARGNVTVSNSTLRRGNEPLDLVATDGALALTVTGSQLQAYKEDVSGPVPTVGEHCIDLVARGSAIVGATIGDRTSPTLGNTFLNCRVGSVRLLHDVGATGTFDAIVARNTFVVDDHESPSGADFVFPMGGVLAQSRGAAGSSMNIVAFTNTFDEVTNASGGVGQLTLSAEGGQFQAEVVDNTFDTPGNAPWYIRAAENVSGRIRLAGNHVVAGFFTCPDLSCGGGTGYNAPGLRAIADVQRGGQLHLTIDGDAFAHHDTVFDPGNTVEIQANNVGAAPTVCAALRGNQSPDGYALEQHAGSLNLYSWMSGATGTCTSGTAAACSTVLVDNNNTGGGNNPATTPPALSITGTIGVTSAACQVPSGGIFQP